MRILLLSLPLLACTVKTLVRKDPDVVVRIIDPPQAEHVSHGDHGQDTHGDHADHGEHGEHGEHGDHGAHEGHGAGRQSFELCEAMVMTVTAITHQMTRP